jgi:hypothetical protein
LGGGSSGAHSLGGASIGSSEFFLFLAQIRNIF